VPARHLRNAAACWDCLLLGALSATCAACILERAPRARFLYAA